MNRQHWIGIAPGALFLMAAALTFRNGSQLLALLFAGVALFWLGLHGMGQRPRAKATALLLSLACSLVVLVQLGLQLTDR